MTQEVIRKLLQDHLASMPGNLATAWENKAFVVPAPDVPYQVVHLLAAPTSNPTLQETLNHDRGILQVMLRYPPAMGTQPAELQAKRIQERFPALLTLTNGTITVRVRGKPVIAPAIAGSDRYAVPVSIRYECFSKE